MEATLQYEVLLLEKVLRVSLSDKPVDVRFPRLLSSAQDLKQFSKASLSQQLTFIDSILMERYSLPQTRILEYAAETLMLVKEELGKSWSVRNDNCRSVLNYLAEVVVSYAALSVSQEDIFPEQANPGDAATRLLTFVEVHTAPEFLAKLVESWDDPEFKAMLFGQMLNLLVQQTSHTTIQQQGFTCLTMLRTLVSLPGVTELLMNHQWFPPQQLGIVLEKGTSIGPFFQMSYCPREEDLLKPPGRSPPENPLRAAMFADMERSKSMSDLYRKQDWYRNETKRYVEGLVDLSKRFLRIDKNRWLEWVKLALKLNKAKAKLGSQLGSANNLMLSSNGFLFNLLDVFLALCMPIVQSKDDKSSKIDPRYLLSDPEFAKETPLCYDAPKAAEIPAEFGTITEFYFLCMKLLSVAWTGFKESFMALDRINSQIRNRNDPNLEDDKKYFGQLTYVYDTFIRDSYRNVRIKNYYTFTMSLILKWIGFNRQIEELPPPCPALGQLPEHLIEDLNEFFYIMLNMESDFLNNFHADDLLLFLTFTIVAFKNPEYMKNPYLRAKLGQNACSLVNRRACGDSIGVINSDPFVKDNMLIMVIRFFVDAESTGTHNQFYDKFVYRHIASKTLEYLWTFQSFQSQFIGLAHTSIFVRFVNMLVNDTVFFLDDGLKQITKIKEFENREKNGETLTPEEEKDKDSAQKYGSYMLQEANSSMSLLQQISQWNSELFMQDEFRDRIAATLNYNLKCLCGPKCLELKVDNPDQYNFKPKELHSCIMRLFLNLSQHPSFLHSVVRDERSYDSAVLQKAGRIAAKHGLVARFELTNWDGFVAAVKESAQESQNLADKLTDIPDEFLCPITYDLMKNPVKLPSGYIVDRTSITRVLLTDEHDPFTRNPLTVDMLEEAPELKTQIEDWIREKTA